MKFALVLMSMVLAGVFANAQGTEAAPQSSGAVVEQKAEVPVKKEKKEKHKKHSKKEKSEKSEKTETK